MARRFKLKIGGRTVTAALRVNRSFEDVPYEDQ